MGGRVSDRLSVWSAILEESLIVIGGQWEARPVTNPTKLGLEPMARARLLIISGHEQAVPMPRVVES